MNRVLCMTSVLAVSACAAAEEVTTITVTGRLRVVNGVSEVPRGLFGVHAMNGLTDEIARDWGIESVRTIEVNPTGTPRQPGTGQGHGLIPSHTTHVVECWYDRFRPALQLTDPDGWDAALRERAATWAAAAKDLTYDTALEFWNEPYLNWASRPGSNYDGRFYTRDGDVVMRRGRAEPTLAWTRQIVAVNPDSGQVDYVASRYLPERIEPGQTFQWRQKTWEARHLPWVRDTQQPSWWSGPFNRGLYHEMVSVLGPAIKDANPAATLVLGWDFHLFQDRWNAWNMLHRPLIDHAIAWMDGLSEHHYGGDTRAVAGSYEVAYAYALATHGKRLRFYNTEAGGFLDPERPGSGAAPGPDGRDAVTRRLQGSAYMLRDVIHLVAVCPDKAVARAAHMPDVYGGEEAFRLLKPLRGRLMEVHCSDPDIWAVASLDGDALCVVAFNDTTQPRKVHLAGAGAACDDPTRELPPRSATAWVVTHEADADTMPVTVLTQHVADKARQDIPPGGSLQLTIAVPAEGLARAAAARVKLVQAPWSRPAEGGWVVTLNGERMALQLPHAGGWIGWTDIDPARLREDNVFEFTSAIDLPHAAAVDALSVELIHHHD
jgi:hypothetical protein